MHFAPSTPDDLGRIVDLFRQAIKFQLSLGVNSWRSVNQDLLASEIREQLHWKIVDEGEIACFFSIAFTDALVWDVRDADPSLYLHRIITNPAFRGRGYVTHITAWAEGYGRAAGKRYIRLDTHVENQRLNQLYQDCGYTFCGVKVFDDDSDLRVPRHYLGAGLSLYQRAIH